MIGIFCPYKFSNVISYKFHLVDVQDGMMAQQAYLEIINEETTPEHKQSLIDSLSKYCEMDTLAMVKLVQNHSRTDE